jgi:hypothetical protein
MTNTQKIIIGAGFAIAIAANAFFYLTEDEVAAKTALTPAQTALNTAGEQCMTYAQNAVANDVPTIEFQRLEHVAKIASVIERCMDDSGYLQNPAWLKLAQPIANADAAKSKISPDEALINLSRKDMQVFLPVKNQPDYWVKK